MAAWVIVIACVTGSSALQQRGSEAVKSPIVLLVGCAAPSAEPHVWILSHAGGRTISTTPGITDTEKQNLQSRAMGSETYQLIGVADFVDPESSRRVGVRGKIFSSPRVNATGMLASGHRVAVKGLFIEARPARINLTSVVDLSSTCP